MISDPEQKIGRPRQLYTGPTQRDYVPVGPALGGGQSQREARALAGRAFQRDVTAHRTGKPARDGEARGLCRRFALHAFEALEDSLLIGRVDPRTFVRRQ